MNTRLNRQIVAELQRLETADVLDLRQVRRIAERYPTTPWDVVMLVRAFTILGAISAGAGAVVFATEYVNSIRLLEGGLAIAAVLLIAGARWVAQAKDMPRTAAAMEMGAGFAVQGLTTVLAIEFSTGSKNWPALVGAQTILLAAMAYALRNRLVLSHAAVMCFIWFGGETGYVSGWGMYWLGMSYPMRFVAAGAVALAVAWLHASIDGPFQPFARVYAHFGSLVMHIALWIMSLFGSFRDYQVSWDNDAERLMFTLIWAIVSGAFLFAGARYAVGLLRSYGIVFLIINVYTFYFQFVAAHTLELWWVHLLLVGGSLLALGFQMERRLHGTADKAG